MKKLSLLKAKPSKQIQKKQNNNFPFYNVYKPQLEIELLDKLVLVNHKYNFIYFRIPKAANSTIVSSLYFAETGKVITSLDDIQIIKDTYYNRPSSLSHSQLKKIQNDYFKFTFVRNPYTRIIAAYLNKIIPNKNGKCNRVAKFLGRSPDTEISFSDFLEYLEQGGINQNAHWARQHDLLPIPLEEFDFIGRTENLTNDLNYVLAHIFKTKPQIVSVREHKTNAERMLQELDKKTKNRILKLYKVDLSWL